MKEEDIIIGKYYRVKETKAIVCILEKCTPSRLKAVVIKTDNKIAREEGYIGNIYISELEEYGIIEFL